MTFSHKCKLWYFQSIVVDLPVIIKTNLYKSKLFLLSGINLSFERLFTFSEFEGFDPEIDSRRFPKRNIGFGYSFALAYSFNKRFEIFGGFKTNINNDYSFNNFSLGFKTNIASR